jgi:hypothetical protein
MIITPVKTDRAEDLQSYLRGLPHDPPPPPPDSPDLPRGSVSSPFGRALPPTHFGRFVVIELDMRPHLLFSSRFDGRVHDYLRALAKTDEAQTIWDHCELPRDADGRRVELESYLLDPAHHVSTQYVLGSFPHRSTVGEINAALALRTELAGFAAHAAELGQLALAHDFRQLPSIRHLMVRR